jgi:hypothetical protein
MAGPHLRITVLPDRHGEIVEVPEGRSLDQELRDFMDREGRFAQDWVPIKAGPITRFLRYDQIVQVEARLD